MLEILSLGAGVQSTTVLRMSIHGELPKLDHAIFSDTGWESKAVYEHLATLEQEAQEAGIALHRVGKGTLRDDILRSQVRGERGIRHASMPLRVVQKNGDVGMVRRQCTPEYKIVPIEKKVREILGLKFRQHWPKHPVVRQWMGISFDEITRANESERIAVQFWYPLVDRRITRRQCLEWNVAHGYPEPPRSACLACPFRSDAEWRRLKQSPAEWDDAVAFDRMIRDCNGMRGQAFVHRKCRPLAEVDLRTDVERGQGLLWGDWAGECSGYCGC